MKIVIPGGSGHLGALSLLGGRLLSGFLRIQTLSQRVHFRLERLDLGVARVDRVPVGCRVLARLRVCGCGSKDGAREQQRNCRLHLFGLSTFSSGGAGTFLLTVGGKARRCGFPADESAWSLHPRLATVAWRIGN